MNKNFFKHWQRDIPAGLVVFLVALPLCLGIGLASTSVEGVTGLPNIFSGIVAGIVGGIVVGFLSGSRLGVSGPAAGLITIIITSIGSLGSYEAFLVAVFLSGVIQIIAGFLRAGIVANYVPSSVIKGMLAAIGITLMLKEIPHLVGYDADFFGDDSFFQNDGHNTFSELIYSFKAMEPGAIVIGVFSLLVLVFFENTRIKRLAFTRFVPGALVVVVSGALINVFFESTLPGWFLTEKHMVNLPIAKSLGEFTSFLTFPDFTFLLNPKVYLIAITIALVGSLETMLSVEATDKLDPRKKHTPTNRELKAQGVGNMMSGLIGGLPVTQVIVRSSANISSRAESKLSAVFHGFLLLGSVMFIPNVLNYIPLAALAAILMVIGYKLAKIQLFKEMYKLGYDQLIPFITTIVAVLFTDLLRGILVGLGVAIIFLLRRYLKIHFVVDKKSNTTTITLAEHVSFINKSGIQEALVETPNGSKLVIDATRNKFIDHDVKEILQEFKNFRSKDRSITVELIDLEL